MITSLLDLSNLNGKNGFVIPGLTEEDNLGTEVNNAGDINGDGIEDLIISAINAGEENPDPLSFYDSDRRGKTYVIFGKKNFNSNFDLNSLNGSNGFTVTGIEAYNNLGSGVSTGDINGDGIDDLAVTAPLAGTIVTDSNGFSFSQGNGEAYIIFGQKNSYSANFNLQSLNGSNGFILRGIDPGDNLGTAITSAGDINGDGIDDIAVSADDAGKLVTNDAGFESSDRRGKTYIIFGKQNGFNSSINIAQLNGNNGFVIEGKNANDNLGSELSNAGDINGDGIDDLMIGTSGAGELIDNSFGDGFSDQRGETYVIFGRKNGFDAKLNLNNLNGSNGFTISGIHEGDHLGSAVSNAGDLNGDGLNDLIIGAKTASASGEYTTEGEVYVIFGQQGNFNAQFDLNSLNGNNGFTVSGLELDDNLGNAVSSGDFNSDGIDDLLIGANNAGQSIYSPGGFRYSDLRGESYLIFGKKNGFTAQIDLANLNQASGFKISGANRNDTFGTTLSIAGDINGDGGEDLLISAPNVDLTEEFSREGTAYVVFGSPATTVELPNLPPPLNNGKPINPPIIGTDQSDLLLGDIGNDQILGLNGNDTIRGKSDEDLLYGNAGNDFLDGGYGYDTLDGGKNNDTLIGFNGNDSLKGGADQDQLEGGIGNDTLNGNGGRDFLFGNSGDDFLEGSYGWDVLNGGQNNDTLIGFNGNDSLLGGSEEDRLVGGIGNDTLIGDLDNDILYGGNGEDVLHGSRPNSLEAQLSERDTLSGGAAADKFVLGDTKGIYYDDRNPDTPGEADFAIIKDFNPQEDKIQLKGNRDSYDLSFFNNSQGELVANIIFLGNNNETPEKIAIIRNVSPQLTIDDPAFTFV